MSRLDTCLLRVLNSRGVPVGAGFLVMPNLAVTCAHVVKAAQRNLAGNISIDFPLLADHKSIAARVVFNNGDQDIAGLEIVGNLPQEAKPTRLITVDDLWDHRYRAFGFPAGHDGGVYSSGVLRGRTANGLLQFDSDTYSAYAVQPGFSGGPVWDEQLGGVVGMIVAAESDPAVRAAFCLPAAVIADAWPQLRQQAIPPNPYRGLAAFREEDAGLFFGRANVVDQLLERVKRQPFTALVGSSGSGKSSVIYAGLIPQLRRDVNWLIATFRPGTQPFESLAAALLVHLEPQMSEVDRLVETRKLARLLFNGDVRLEDVGRRILTKQSSARRLLLDCDQFEELFTLSANSEIHRRFLDTLMGANNPLGEGSVTLFIALRADFLSLALAYRSLADHLQGATYMLGPMNREELRQAMVGPADQLGVVFEAGLDDLIFDQIEGRPGELPLLEFALTLMWEDQKNRILTLESYQHIGGVTRALARYADNIVDHLSPEEQKVTRQIFTQLVQPGQGSQDTRRLAISSEIGEARWMMVQRLADLRLVVTGRTLEGIETVEIVHEAMIHAWDRLREWMRLDREFRAWQERLRNSMRQWQEAKEDEGALLRGLPLSEANDWRIKSKDLLNLLELQYIQKSLEFDEGEKEKNRKLTALKSMADNLSKLSAVLSGSSGLDELVQNIVETLNDVLKVDAASLYLFNDVENRLEIRAAAGYHKPLLKFGAEYRIGEGLIGRIALENKPLLANDLAQLREMSSYRGKYDSLRINRNTPSSFYGTPLKVVNQERPVGVLKFEKMMPGAFSEEEVLIIQIMSNFIAAVIYNTKTAAMQFTQLSEQLQSLSPTLTGGYNLTELCQNVTDKIQEILNADAACFYLWDEESNKLVIRAASGYQKPLLEHGASYRLGEGVTGKIAQDCKPIVVNNLDELSKSSPSYRGKFDRMDKDPRVGAFMGFPLIIHQQDKIWSIGVFKVERMNQKPFSDSDIILSEMMANIIATVIYNATYHSEKPFIPGHE